MIRPDQIPPEAVKAAWQAMMAPDALAMHRAIAAAINAWPGMVQNYNWDGSRWRIVLPNWQEGEA